MVQAIDSFRRKMEAKLYEEPSLISPETKETMEKRRVFDKHFYAFEVSIEEIKKVLVGGL